MQGRALEALCVGAVDGACVGAPRCAACVHFSDNLRVEEKSSRTTPGC